MFFELLFVISDIFSTAKVVSSRLSICFVIFEVRFSIEFFKVLELVSKELPFSKLFFACVAGEVRNLANKSAEAANEIKKLVEIANQKAHEGKDISNEMQNGYKNLHTHITETLQIIQNVSDAANEQMVGINQVSQTIVSLDQISKDNQKETNLINDISNVVSSMAIEVLEDAKNKKF